MVLVVSRRVFSKAKVEKIKNQKGKLNLINLLLLIHEKLTSGHIHEKGTWGEI